MIHNIERKCSTQLHVCFFHSFCYKERLLAMIERDYIWKVIFTDRQAGFTGVLTAQTLTSQTTNRSYPMLKDQWRRARLEEIATRCFAPLDS